MGSLRGLERKLDSVVLGGLCVDWDGLRSRGAGLGGQVMDVREVWEVLVLCVHVVVDVLLVVALSVTWKECLEQPKTLLCFRFV